MPIRLDEWMVQQEEKRLAQLQRQKELADYRARIMRFFRNDKRLLIMWIVISMLIIMCMFPPWKYHHASTSGVADKYVAGPYRLLFLGPPSIPVGWPYEKEYFKGYIRTSWHPELDWIRFLIPMFVLALIAVGLIVSFRDRSQPIRQR